MDASDLQALVESEAKFRQFADNALVVFWVCEPDASKFYYISPGYEKIWGKSCASIYENPRSFLESVHPDDLERVVAAATGDNAWNMNEDYRIIHADGQIRWVSDRTFPVYDDQGKLYRMVGFAEDISERKLAEIALVTSEQKFRQLADHLDVVFWVSDPAVTDCYYISPGYEKIWGRPCASIYANPKSFAESIHPDDREKVFAAAFGKENCGIAQEYRIICPDGDIRWIYQRTFPVNNKNGNLYRQVGIAEDITERKQAEDIQSQIQRERITNKIIQAIRTSLNLETIFNIAVNEIGQLLEIDHVKISKFVSEENGWLTVAEYLSHSGIAKSVGTYIPDKGNPGTAKLKQLEIFRIDDTNNCESEVILQIAQTFPGAWLILPLHFNSIIWGSLCLLIDGRPRYWQEDEIRLITNIADQLSIAIQQSQLYHQIQQLAEQEIYKTLQRERELSDAKSNFIATTSHQIRTPLATIQSSLDMLHHYSDRLNEEKKESHFQKIEFAVQRIQQIVQDTLLLSEAEAGTLQFEPKLVDVVQLCKGAIEEITDNQNRIRFTTNTEASQCLIDSKLIGYIINNLLENALKYSPQNTTVKFDLNCTQSAVIFSIQDQGIGIPKENLPHIFDSFYRANNVDISSGTGLGLAIVKQCVDLHKGEIEVVSKVNEGARFTIVLPFEVMK